MSPLAEVLYFGDGSWGVWFGKEDVGSYVENKQMVK
jgi:hypothetical protein